MPRSQYRRAVSWHEGKIRTMTVQQIARLEGVTARQIQRYCSEGYQGNKLPASRIGKAFVIEEVDYRQWRRQCGFEPAELIPEPQQPQPQVSVSQPEESLQPIAPPAPMFPPWPMAADPHGQLTTTPSEHSCNFPHPLACEQHRQEQLRKQIERLRGYSNEQQ
jgi:hypothetical protein